MKHYPLSLACGLLIWIVSLVPIPETPLDDVAFIDKWTHLVMYGTLTFLIGIETLLCHRGIATPRLALRALPLPILMGGLVEIVQATCTGGVRNGDWMDFFANSVGALLGFALVLIVRQARRKAARK